MLMYRCGTFLLALLPLLVSSTAVGGSADIPVATSSIRVTQLKTEHLTEPLAVETQRPRFRWILESSERGQLQTAYQVLVASSLERLLASKADKWDSGKIRSDNSVEVSYAGRELVSGERAYWKVRIWDQDGRASDYSESSFFEMGLLQSRDWQGKWIAADTGSSAPLLRRDFMIDAPVQRARVYVSGLGYFELSLNGQKVGDHVLDPAPTYYHSDQRGKLKSRVLYATYDVTQELKVGANAFGVILGNGWFNPRSTPPWTDPGSVPRVPYGDRPCLILQLNVEFIDGRTMSVVSDTSWRTSASPITSNSHVHGETYDARLEKRGWDAPGFNDSAWAQALPAEAPNGVLTSQLLPPARVTETLPAMRVVTPKSPELFENTFVYDFGQLFTGWARVTIAGARGTRVVLKYGSRLYPEDDTLDNRSNTPANDIALQTDTYILKGDGQEVWEPRFTLHGFRYVEVRTYLENGDSITSPNVQHIDGRFVRSAVESTGSFVSSNELINSIHQNVRRSFASSLQGLPQDAADRSERDAYLGDPTYVAEDYLYNYDMIAFWEKWLHDIAGAQTADGSIPIISPMHRKSAAPSASPPWPSWQSTYLLLAWHLYQYCGNRRVLEDHYSNMSRFVEFLGRSTQDNLLPDEPLGDHMEPQNNGSSSMVPRHTPAALTANAHYYQDVWTLAQIAQVLGRSHDAKAYDSLATRIKDAFNRRFLNPTTNQYATGSQTSNAVPLYLRLTPPEKIRAVMKNLVDDINQHSGHLTTGIIGSNAVVQVLPRYGESELMYKLSNQTTFPSLGHQVVMGATALCESYECAPWLSQNMKMFGSLDKFFYRNLAGISPASPSYSRVRIQPLPLGDLTSVSASQRTVRGTISLDWNRFEDAFELKVSIPAGVIGEIALPINQGKDSEVLEGKKTIWTRGAYVSGVRGLAGAKASSTSIDLQVGSGSYHFRVLPRRKNH